MLLTLDPSLNGGESATIECRTGARAREVFAELGLSRRDVWCGPERVLPESVLGTPPLVHAARLAAHPTPPGPGWRGPHLVSVAGPDVGHVLAIEGVTECGSGGPAGWQDPTMDPLHARARVRSDGRLELTDAGSVNGTWRWRAGGRGSWHWPRRSTVLSPGQRAVLGSTVVEYRGGAGPAATLSGPRTTGTDRAAAMLDPTRSAFDPMTRGSQTRGSSAWWEQPVLIDGPARVETARAIILARGRQPPHPVPVHEPWQAWLPPARQGDGPVLLRHAERPQTLDGPRTPVHLTAEPLSLTIDLEGTRVVTSACAVSQAAAERIAREIAARAPAPSPALTLGDLESSGGTAVGADDTDVTLLPWTLDLDSPCCILAAGARSSGRSTMLATLATVATAFSGTTPHEVVAIGDRNDPAFVQLGNCVPIERWRSHADAEGVLRWMAQTDSEAPTLVLVDDADALAPDALVALSSLIARATRDSRVRVVVTAARPSGVYGAAEIAGATALVALRSESGAASADLVGVEDAATIPPDRPGVAILLSGGRRRRVRIALPSHARSPSARRV